jgi:hypothetical protein
MNTNNQILEHSYIKSINNHNSSISAKMDIPSNPPKESSKRIKVESTLYKIGDPIIYPKSIEKISVEKSIQDWGKFIFSCQKNFPYLKSIFFTTTVDEIDVGVLRSIRGCLERINSIMTVVAIMKKSQKVMVEVFREDTMLVSYFY